MDTQKRGFNSPSLGQGKAAAAGRSRPPRLAKLRKPVAGHRPNLSRPVFQDIQDSGFESSRIDSGPENVGRGSVFMARDSIPRNFSSYLFGDVEKSTLVDEMRRLGVESSASESMNMNMRSCGGSGTSTRGCVNLSDESHGLLGVDERAKSELPGEMRRLHIGNEQFSNLHGQNVDEELHYKMKELDIKEFGRDNYDWSLPVSIFTGEQVGMTQPMEFKTPETKGPIVLGLNRKVETKRESVKDIGLKKKKGKWKKSDKVLPRKFQENAESSESCSPMDVSPYEETLVDNSFSRETSDASEESFLLDENSSSESHPDISSDIPDEVLVSAAEHLCINECNVKKGLGEESTVYVNEGIVVGSTEEDGVSGAETESFKSATEELDYSADSFVIGGDAEVESCSSSMRQDDDGGSQYNQNTKFADIGTPSFIFAASSATLSEISAPMCVQRKKHGIKVGHDSHTFVSTAKVSHDSSHLPLFGLRESSSSSHEQGLKEGIKPMQRRISQKPKSATLMD